MMNTTTTSLVDEFLPVYDVSDAVATTVQAPIDKTWDALLAADLIDVGKRSPLAAVLGALRTLPDMVFHAVHGEPIQTPAHLRLHDLPQMPMEQGGWVLLGERAQDEIALGLVGKFWLPVIPFKAVAGDAFRDFAEPGYAKTVYSLSVRAIDPQRTLLSGVMRTATTDAQARRWFHAYWTLGVGSGAHVLVNSLLDLVRETAEA